MATESDLKLLVAKLEARLQDLEAKDAAEGGTSLTPAEIAEISATAAASAHQKVNQWWDDRTYEEKSDFNPLGDKNHPKPAMARDVFWCGMPLKADQMTREEIELVNQLRPGVFDRHEGSTGRIAAGGRGYFKVRELDPGIPDGRLLVLFPFKGEQAHAALHQYSRGRGMVDMLLEMLPKVEEPVRA